MSVDQPIPAEIFALQLNHGSGEIITRAYGILSCIENYIRELF